MATFDKNRIIQETDPNIDLPPQEPSLNSKSGLGNLVTQDIQDHKAHLEKFLEVAGGSESQTKVTEIAKGTLNQLNEVYSELDPQDSISALRASDKVEKILVDYKDSLKNHLTTMYEQIRDSDTPYDAYDRIAIINKISNIGSKDFDTSNPLEMQVLASEVGKIAVIENVLNGEASAISLSDSPNTTQLNNYKELVDHVIGIGKQAAPTFADSLGGFIKDVETRLSTIKD